MAGSTSPTSRYYVYELRRVGSKATCGNVKDIFRLHKHQNVFGRNSEKVDFYLNSGIHKQLISRQHAELLVYQGEDGQPVFVVHDRSMNGTFVNDIKISKMIRIKEFDTITFGHVQGVSIKAGMYAEQTESEFRFVLEKVLVNASEDNFNMTDFPNFSTSPLYYHSAKCYLKSGIESCLENKKYTSCEKSVGNDSKRSPHAGISGRSSIDVNGRVYGEVENASLNTSHKLLERESKMILSKFTDSLITGARSTTSTSFKKNPSLNLDHPEESGTHVCKLDHLNKEDGSTYRMNLDNQLRHDEKVYPVVTDTVGDGEVLAIAATAIRRATTIMDADSEPFSLGDDVSDLFHSNKLSICDPLSDKPNISDDVIEVTKDTADVTIRYPVHNQSLKKFAKALPLGRSEASTSHLEASILKEQDVKRKHSVLPKEPVQISTKLASLKALENLKGKITLNYPLKQMSMTKLNKRTSEVLSKNRRTELKKSRLGTYRNFSPTTSEVFVPEQCASIDCCRPLDNTISWVQCDDCDCWYHVTCMGCDYKVVREPSAFFHCGCT